MKIREYQKDDFTKLIDTMCDAFQDDVLYTCFIEDKSARIEFLKKFMKFRLKVGLKKGTVFVSDDGEGVLVLLAPNKGMNLMDLIQCGGIAAILRCNKLQRTKISEFNTFAETQAKKTIKQPYWHISPICVSHQAQGKGYGAALMNHALQYIKQGSPCYLETQNPENLSFYKKYGFIECSDDAWLDTGIRNFSMVYDNP